MEYNNYFNFKKSLGNQIPPKWHGWLSYQYDEVPAPDSSAFHDPFFERKHDWNYYDSANKMFIPGQTFANAKTLEYLGGRRDRYAKEWEPSTKRA